MAGTFKFELVTPERVLLSAPAEQVLVPGADGDFTVLPDHAPVISTLRPGLLEARMAGGKSVRVFVRGGFCEVDPASLTVLAEKATDVGEVGAAGLAAELKTAEADLAAATSDEARWSASLAVERLSSLQG
jgi:F-type H+-transporting ATPase subunit epsilon